MQKIKALIKWLLGILSTKIARTPIGDDDLCKTEYKVVVLSQGAPHGDLQRVAWEAVEGSYSWHYQTVSQITVTPKEMAELLMSQGSDPEFLLGEDYGNL